MIDDDGWSDEDYNDQFDISNRRRRVHNNMYTTRSNNRFRKLQIEEVEKEIAFLVCPICHGQLVDPYSLPCLHSYCKTCLESYSNHNAKNKLKCPTCRSEYKFGSWKKDFRCEEFIKYFKNKADKNSKNFQVCDLCDKDIDDIEIHLCKECSEVLCLDCSIYHKKIKKTRDHTVYPLDSESNPICSAHDKKLEIFCKNCCDCICVVCGLIEHNGHQMSSIEEQANFFKKEIGSLLANNDKKLFQIKNFLSRNRQTKARIEEKFDKMLSSLTQRREEVIQIVNDSHKDLTKMIKDKKMNAIKEIEDNFEKNIAVQEDFEGLSKYTTSFLSEKSVFTICSIFKKIQTASNSGLQCFGLDLAQYETLELLHVPRSSIEQQLKQFVGYFNNNQTHYHMQRRLGCNAYNTHYMY